jgi:hypothetical protein
MSGILKDGATPKSSRSNRQCRWYKHKRYEETAHPSQWNDPETSCVVMIPKNSMYLPLNWYFTTPGKPRVDEWERIVDQHPQVANGWTKDELDVVRRFLNGTVMLIDGFLRVMPSPPEKIDVEITVSDMRAMLNRMDKHIAAGRIPILKEATKQRLLDKAETWEKRTYGNVW